RLGDPQDMPPALRAQLFGLRAELSARLGDIETALIEYELCERAWEDLGRITDASEAALESVLAAASPSSAEGSARFVPSLELLNERLERGRKFLRGQENALLLLALARVAYFAG